MEEMKRKLGLLAKAFKEKENGAACAHSALEAARYISGLRRKCGLCVANMAMLRGVLRRGDAQEEAAARMEKIEKGEL